MMELGSLEEPADNSLLETAPNFLPSQLLNFRMHTPPTDVRSHS